MLAAHILAPHSTSVHDSPTPQVGDYDVLINVKNAGICGTDIHILKGEYPLANFPVIPGHEFSGVVSAVGAEVRNIAVGDRVTADPNVACNRCYYCQRNRQNQCERLKVIGVNCHGAFAQQIAIDESAVFPIGEISFAAAALIEPLACVLWGLKQVQIQAGSEMLILGAGPMGCLMMQAAKRSGAAWVGMVDVSPTRLALAASLGADATLLTSELDDSAYQYAFDVVADATGVPKVIESTPNYVRSGGTIWVFGVAPDDAHIALSPADIFRRDLRIIGSFAVNKTFQESIALVNAGGVQLEPLISHRLPLNAFAEALDIAQFDEQRMKVQFEL